MPHSNEKQIASQFEIAAGGPATNASITFRSLGNTASLLSVIGCHPLAGLIKNDLIEQQVKLVDLLETRIETPPLSSILVTQSTGERAVISRNAVNIQAAITNLDLEYIQRTVLENAKVILVDGHQIEVSEKILQIASQNKVLAILDGGSWKPGLDKLLPLINYAICSADFFPPNCSTPAETVHFLKKTLGSFNRERDIPTGIAITNGEQPIQYSYKEQSGRISVPSVRVIDSLGAGDIFHGAFCHFILQTSFIDAIQQAAIIASQSCRSFGTRQWLNSA